MMVGFHRALSAHMSYKKVSECYFMDHLDFKSGSSRSQIRLVLTVRGYQRNVHLAINTSERSSRTIAFRSYNILNGENGLLA